MLQSRGLPLRPPRAVHPPASPRRGGWPAAVLVAALLAAPLSSRPGVRPLEQHALANADFAAGAAQWQQSPASAFAPALSPGGVPSLRCELAAGATAALSQTLGVGSLPGAPRAGDKLELGLRLRTSPAALGRVWCELVALAPSGATTLARSAAHDVAALPDDRGHWIATLPLPGVDARVPADAFAVRVDVHVAASGPLWLERVESGRFGYVRWPLAGADFEGPALDPAWTGSGAIGLLHGAAGAYRGDGALRLDGAGTARIEQLVALDGLAGTPSQGRVGEAGAWLFVPTTVALPLRPSPAHEVELVLRAWEQGTPSAAALDVARVVWRPTAADAGAWTWIESAPLAPLPADRSHLRLVLEKRYAGELRVDGVQLGERWGPDGNSVRQATAHYVGPFRSPWALEAVTQPAASGEIWRNWHWTAPPLCDAGLLALGHDPECATSVACFRHNGRRDGAVSVLETLDDLPLAGAYDSRDRDVLRYHVRLARAAGLDSFTYLHQGHTLAAQTQAFGLEPLNAQVYAALLDVVEEQGGDFKLAVMYEPKVHFNGWVQGEPAKSDKLAGITADLVQLVDQAGRRKAALQRDGRLVVFLFRNDVCDASGTQCLGGADWEAIRAEVEHLTGRGLWLVADVPQAGQAFGGLSRWELIALPLLRYRTWSAFASGTPSLPAPAPADVRAHAEALASIAADWEAVDDRDRLAVAIAWPGFDDSGVAGWGAANGVGLDGQPLCVRVAPDLDGLFLDATLRVARESRADWLQIASWNDWNERTQVEPRWEGAFAAALRAGDEPDPAAAQVALARLLRLRQHLAAFKGGPLPLGSAALLQPAADYLWSAAHDPQVVAYD
jgi:hypothetical protein